MERDPNALHKFERAGLGKAPFRFVGMYEKTYQASPDAPVQVGTCCDYCGTGIRYVCQIRASDGREFKVGTDCVAKVGDAGLVKAIKSSPEMRKHRRDLAAAKDGRVRDEIAAILANPPAALVAAKLRGRQNYEWCDLPAIDVIQNSLRYSGAAGRARNLKLLKEIIAPTGGRFGAKVPANAAEKQL